MATKGINPPPLKIFTAQQIRLPLALQIDSPSKSLYFRPIAEPPPTLDAHNILKQVIHCQVIEWLPVELQKILNFIYKEKLYVDIKEIPQNLMRQFEKLTSRGRIDYEIIRALGFLGESERKKFIQHQDFNGNNFVIYLDERSQSSLLKDIRQNQFFQNERGINLTNLQILSNILGKIVWSGIQNQQDILELLIQSTIPLDKKQYRHAIKQLILNPYIEWQQSIEWPEDNLKIIVDAIFLDDFFIQGCKIPKILIPQFEKLNGYRRIAYEISRGLGDCGEEEKEKFAHPRALPHSIKINENNNFISIDDISQEEFLIDIVQGKYLFCSKYKEKSQILNIISHILIRMRWTHISNQNYLFHILAQHKIPGLSLNGYTLIFSQLVYNSSIRWHESNCIQIAEYICAHYNKVPPQLIPLCEKLMENYRKLTCKSRGSLRNFEVVQELAARIATKESVNTRRSSHSILRKLRIDRQQTSSHS